MTSTSSPLSARQRAQRPALTLGVETSCDDTACAVVDDAGRVLASVVSSQLAVHAPYGGVVPELASREHLRNWPPVLRAALSAAQIELREVDRVAATRGPGLVGSLLVGLHLGKALALGLDAEFAAVHHLEGHLYSPFLQKDASPALPVPAEFVGLVVSGGHTSLVGVQRAQIESLGTTRDDAMGEALDKLGKRLGLPFPGGPHVDRLADAAQEALGLGEPAGGPSGNAGGQFRIPRCGDTLDLSFSGLKSQAMRALEALAERGLVTHARSAQGEGEGAATDALLGLDEETLRLVVDFRAAAVEQLIDRLEKLHRERQFAVLAVSGGVAACRALRRRLRSWSSARAVSLQLVELVYCGDNAAMIAFAAQRATLRSSRAAPHGAQSVDDENGGGWLATATSRLPLGAVVRSPRPR